jgi:hypothetical protein
MRSTGRAKSPSLDEREVLDIGNRLGARMTRGTPLPHLKSNMHRGKLIKEFGAEFPCVKLLYFQAYPPS